MSSVFVNYYCSCALFHVRVLCFSYDFIEQKQDQRQRTTITQTQQQTHITRTKDSAPTTSTTNNVNTISGEQKKIKKQEIIQAELMLFLSFIVCFCCILCVAGCVLSFGFLILVLMVWYFFFFFVLFQCSCSLFHIRVLCVSFDC